MRLPIAFLALAVVACGPAAKHGPTSPPIVVAPPPPPPFIVATATSFGAFVVDATHLYWADDTAIYRRALGLDQKAERLFATEGVDLLAPGSADLFFVDGDDAIRALPLAGGNARTLETAAEVPWALHAEGDTVWYGVAETLIGVAPAGRKTIEITGVLTQAFAADGGHAYLVRYDADVDGYRLLDIDLAAGTMKSISDAEFLSDTQTLAVVGADLILGTSDAAIAIPRKGGKARYSFFGAVTGVAGDAKGYAVGGYNFVVTHAPHEPPHLVATGSTDDTVVGTNTLALAGDYVYYTSLSNATSDLTLRAAPRAGGATMLRPPINGTVTAMGATTGAVFVGFESELGDALFQVGTKKVKLLSPSGYVESIIADDQHVVVTANAEILAMDRTATDGLSSVSAYSYAIPVLHKGKLYWGDGPIIHAASLSDGNAFQVVDASTFSPDLVDVSIGTVAFANEHLYFEVNYGTKLGIASVDEKREISWVWTYEPSADEYGSLDGNVTAVGDHLFVHDGTYVYRVSLDGSSKKVFSGLPKGDDGVAYSITALYAAGDHLLARVYGDGDAIIEIPLEGGTPKTVWTSTLDGNSFSYVAVAPDAVYVYSYELSVILKIPVD